MNILELQAKAAKANSDHEIFLLISNLNIKDLISFFDETEEFFIYSEDVGLARLAKRSKRIAYMRSKERSLKIETKKNGYGSIFSNATKELFGLIHLSTSGTPRVTFFDQYGFSGHADCNCFKDIAKTLHERSLYFFSPDINMDAIFSNLYANKNI